MAILTDSLMTDIKKGLQNQLQALYILSNKIY